MKKLMWTGLVAMLCGVAGAQAPAGAPAGAHGICKDGTYSMAASKSGACNGHKGVQTWYAAGVAKAAGTAGGPAAGGTASVPAPTPAAKPSASMPAPTPVAAKSSAAMPAPTPAAAAAPTAGRTASGKGPAAAAAGKTAAAGGGPGLVWVNTESKVYHCYGTTYYGKTKAGSYMSEADAKSKGARGNRGQACSK